MKFLYASALMLLSTTAISQEIPSLSVGNLSDEAPQAVYQGMLPNGNKLYVLPQDNMPCVVPKEEGVKIVNSPGRLSVPPSLQRMPNPGLYNKPLIPDTIPSANHTVPKLNIIKLLKKTTLQ